MPARRPGRPNSLCGVPRCPPSTPSPEHRDEAHIGNRVLAHPESVRVSTFSLCRPDSPTGMTRRPPSDELPDETFGNARRRRSDEHRIERLALGPTVIPVAVPEPDVVHLERTQPLARPASSTSIRSTVYTRVTSEASTAVW